MGRDPGNILISGGREAGRLWAYFIDHAYAFGGAVEEAQLAQETEGRALRPYIEARSTFRAWWDALDSDQRAPLMQLARRIADLRDEDIRRIVRCLPDGVAAAPTKRFLDRLLAYHVGIIRDSIE